MFLEPMQISSGDFIPADTTSVNCLVTSSIRSPVQSAANAASFIRQTKSPHHCCLCETPPGSNFPNTSWTQSPIGARRRFTPHQIAETMEVALLVPGLRVAQEIEEEEEEITSRFCNLRGTSYKHQRRSQGAFASSDNQTPSEHIQNRPTPRQLWRNEYQRNGLGI